MEKLRPLDVLKTYRYLRIGMIGAVFLLAASITIEAAQAGCLQNSISAYYYTPVRAIFVGTMVAVGLSLIVYKGRGWKEDLSLNLAGMLAPVVAVVPTTDVGRCFSVAPDPLPLDGDPIARWVVASVDNNFYALLIAGAFGLIAALIIWLVNRSSQERATEIEKGTIALMVGTGVALLIAWWLIEAWDDFYVRAHGYAAVLMFAFLALGIFASAWELRNIRTRALTRTYVAIALAMIAGAILIPLFRVFGEHVVFALEASEISLFALYWTVQTVEKWDEEVAAPASA